MNPLISVVIPTYNRKNIVLEAIQSVLQQEPKNYEVIVVDDGSTDKTAEYIKSLKLPVRIINKENGGVASARNAGIKNARGRYIALLDSDDIWLPGILKAQLAYLKFHPNIPLVYTDQYIQVRGRRRKKTRFGYQQPRNMFNLPGFIDKVPIHSSSVMVRKSIFEKMGSFNENLKIHEDTEMWNRISERYKLGFIDKPLAIFRWEADSRHLLRESERKKFVQEGKKYMKLYEDRRQNRELTDEEKKAIKRSHSTLERIEAKLYPTNSQSKT